MPIENNVPGTLQTPVSSGASLATGALAQGNTLNNAGGALGSGLPSGFGGYPRCRLFFSGTFAAAPSNGVIYVWFLRSPDGVSTTYEYGSASAAPTRAFDAVIGLLPGVTTVINLSTECQLPYGNFEVLVQNQSGQTLNSGWTLTLLPLTTQGS